nr:DUF2225 domain-containing protein [Natranaerobius thermophilus]
MLYDKKYTCPVCQKKFTSKKPRHSKLRLKEEHGDFFKEYEQLNPSYYMVNVCYHCGYAYTDQFSSPKPAQIKEIKEQVSENWVPRDYGSIRDFQMAVESLKLGILCGQLKGEKYNILATLLLHTAWIHREAQDYNNEKRFLNLAREYFLKVYQEDTSGQVDLPKLLFLLGELSRRLDKRDEALSWFSKLVSDKGIKDEKMINRAREQWMLIKKEKERQSGEG